jgi:DnaJ-class molecular chaperone
MAISEAPDYYRILRVDPQAEPEVINAAYRKLAAMYHPDVDPSPDAQARMVEINQAYGVLRDPESRAAYDRARGVATARRAQAARAAAPVSTQSSLEGFARAIMMMVISGIILNVIFSAFAGPGGRWMAIGLCVVLLAWKGGPIFRYFSGKG